MTTGALGQGVLTSKIWRKNRDVDKKILGVRGLVTANVLNKHLEKLRKKIPDVSDLVATTVFNVKIGEVENKIPDVSDLVK